MEPLPALRPLLMDAAPLATLMPDTGKWIALAARLKEAFPAQPKTSPNANEVIHLCRVYYAFKQEPLIRDYAYHYEKRVTKPKFLELARDTTDFLHDFMRVRRQWDYLESQGWYTNHDYAVGIDVNYYPDRSGSAYTMSPMFHKDTGGNNVFVNLIFDNQQPIESTEWFVDVQEPGGKRAEWQQKVLPPAHLAELAALRRELRDSGQHKTPFVHGGVLKGDNVFVSWVDDLVWHATPSLAQRMVYATKDAIAAYSFVRLSLQQGATFLQGKARLQPVELLATMADDPDTALFGWLEQRGAGVQDVDFELARTAWAALYDDEPGKARFISDATLRGRADWRMFGEIPQSIAQDTRLDQPGSKAPTLAETPAGLSMVRRANSTDREELKATAARNQTMPRSFVRTWVRVLPKNSQELADAKFVDK